MEGKIEKELKCKYGENCTRKVCKFLHEKVKEKEVAAAKREIKKLVAAAPVSKAASGHVAPTIVAPLMPSMPKSTALVSKAADVPKNMLMAAWLKTSLDPTTPASMPDSVLEDHILKTTLTTADIVVPSGSLGGMFIIPHAASHSVLAWHYLLSSSGHYEFSSVIKMSTDLSVNFDSVRKVAQRMSVNTSTLSAGAFALSGTISAITYDGTLSEIEDLSYNGILAASNEVTDVAMAIPISDGITLLSGDLLGTPFIRTQDISPSQCGTGRCFGRISSYDKAKRYEMNFIAGRNLDGSPAIYPGDEDILYRARWNIDATTPVDFGGQIIISSQQKNYGAQPAYYGTFEVLLETYSPFGQLIRSDIVLKDRMTSPEKFYTIPPINILSSTNLGYGPADTAKYGSPLNFWSGFESPVQNRHIGPMGSVQLSVKIFDVWGESAGWYLQGNCYALVQNGDELKVNNTISVMAYQNVASNSTITVKAESVFEAIMNPSLRENVDPVLAYYDQEIESYCKKVFSMRKRLGLKRVFATSEYNKKLPALLMLAKIQTPRSQEQQDDNEFSSKALSWSDVTPYLNRAKELLLPHLYNAFPEAKLIVEAGTALYDRLKSKASSNLRVRAASCYIPDLTMYGVEANPGPKMMPTFVAEKPKTLADLPDRPVSDPVLWFGDEITGMEAKVMPAMVIVPMVIEFPDGSYGAHLFALVKGDYSAYVNNSQHVRQGSFVIHGWEGVLHSSLSCDITVLPVFNTGSRLVVVDGTKTEENSLDVAIELISSGLTGVFPYVVTGEILGDRVLPVGGFEHKLHMVHNQGMFLVGNDIRADFQVSSLPQVKNLLKHKHNDLVRTIHRHILKNTLVKASSKDKWLTDDDFKAIFDKHGWDAFMNAMKAQGSRWVRKNMQVDTHRMVAWYERAFKTTGKHSTALAYMNKKAFVRLESTRALPFICGTSGVFATLHNDRNVLKVDWYKQGDSVTFKQYQEFFAPCGFQWICCECGDISPHQHAICDCGSDVSLHTGTVRICEFEEEPEPRMFVEFGANDNVAVEYSDALARYGDSISSDLIMKANEILINRYGTQNFFFDTPAKLQAGANRFDITLTCKNDNSFKSIIILNCLSKGQGRKLAAYIFLLQEEKKIRDITANVSNLDISEICKLVLSYINNKGPSDYDEIAEFLKLPRQNVVNTLMNSSLFAIRNEMVFDKTKYEEEKLVNINRIASKIDNLNDKIFKKKETIKKMETEKTELEKQLKFYKSDF